MKFSRCPNCGGTPEGTVDTVPAIAKLVQLEDGTFEWEGKTRLCWDGQATNTNYQGQAMLWCNNCSIEYANTESSS